MEGFVLEDCNADVNSLETAILNDSRLDMENDEDEDMEEECEIVQTLNSTNSQPDELLGFAARAGLFAAQQKKSKKPYDPIGEASLVAQEEKEVMQMQSTLMTAMKKDKRPAVTEDTADSSYHHIHKRSKIDSTVLLTELKQDAEFIDVTDRKSAQFSPEQALEDVMDDLQIRGNKAQERAVRIIGEHFIKGTEEQMLCHISGSAGTGKSHVVRAIVELFKRCGASENLLLSASTGCAAILIDGYTLHALTFLGPFKTKTNQDKLERLWVNVKYLIIDEISMISAHFFDQVSERISKAKSWEPSSIGKPFGGVNLIIMGDIGQLSPVNAASLFSYKLVKQVKENTIQTPAGQGVLNGAFLWRQLNKVVELKDNMRAKGDEHFINMLSRIRCGNAWDGISNMTKGQVGLGQNYGISDYEVLLAR
jgi:DNA replication protein DnaC